MNESNAPWFLQWFNEDYQKFYTYRNVHEAEKQVNFIIEALQLEGKERVLDLGCGMGRHCFAFAEKGYEVLGVDLSPYQIKKAREKLKGSPSLPLRFKQADMRHLQNMGLFHLIINIFTSFGYYAQDADNADFFRIVRRHLHKEGKFFLDFLHPYHVRQDLTPYEERQIDGEMVGIYKKIDGDRIIKTIIFPGREYQEKVKLYDRNQIESMASSHGFRVVEVWNDYEGHPWREKGDRQLFYCLLD